MATVSAASNVLIPEHTSKGLRFAVDCAQSGSLPTPMESDASPSIADASPLATPTTAAAAATPVDATQSSAVFPSLDARVSESVVTGALADASLAQPSAPPSAPHPDASPAADAAAAAPVESVLVAVPMLPPGGGSDAPPYNVFTGRTPAAVRANATVSAGAAEEAPTSASAAALPLPPALAVAASESAASESAAAAPIAAAAESASATYIAPGPGPAPAPPPASMTAPVPASAVAGTSNGVMPLPLAPAPAPAVASVASASLPPLPPVSVSANSTSSSDVPLYVLLANERRYPARGSRAGAAASASRAGARTPPVAASPTVSTAGGTSGLPAGAGSAARKRRAATPAGAGTPVAGADAPGAAGTTGADVYGDGDADDGTGEGALLATSKRLRSAVGAAAGAGGGTGASAGPVVSLAGDTFDSTASAGTPAASPTAAAADAVWEPNPRECCKRGQCLEWYERVVFPDDLREAFRFGATLLTEFNSRFLRGRDAAGTVRNGRVYVAVSSVADIPMLGLFAGQDIKKGEVVTLYGGSRRPATDILAEPPSHHTHTRRIPGSLFVMDGRPHALLFDRASVDLEREFALPAAERTRLRPTLGDRDLLHCVCDGGVGYMTNTGPRATHNVRITTVETRKDGTLAPSLFLVASKDIAKDEEIFSPYNNSDPLNGKLIFEEEDDDDADAAAAEAAAPATSANSTFAGVTPRRRGRPRKHPLPEGGEVSTAVVAAAPASAKKTPAKSPRKR